jgi:hypothetical protein
MIRRLRIAGNAAEDFAGIVGRREHAVLEQARIDVMRAAECREGSTGTEQLERAEMNLLVATQSIGNRSTIPGKRRWIEDDKIQLRNQLLIWRRLRLTFEPIKNIRRFERGVAERPLRSAFLFAPAMASSL